MKGVLRAEVLKVRGRPMAWILLGLLPLLIAALYAILFAGAASADRSASGAATTLEANLRFVNVVSFGDAIVFRVVAVLGIILAGASAGAEYGWRTIIPSALWAGDRGRLVVARAAVLAGFVAVAVGVGFATVAVADLAGNAAMGTLSTGDAHASLLVHAGPAMGGVWLVASFYVLVAAAMGTWTRSAAAAIAAPIVVLLVEPFGAAMIDALGGVAGTLSNVTISHNVDAVLLANGVPAGADAPTGSYPPALIAAAYLVVLTLGALALAARSLVRRDITE